LSGAERILDESLRLQLLSKRVEATVTEPIVNVCSFREEQGPLCTCSYQSGKREGLCRHLVKLAQIVDQNYPVYRGLVSRCLNTENVLKKLRDNGLVTETTMNTFTTTGFGKQVTRLYLKPATGILIRSMVHSNIDDEFGFMNLILSAVESEYGRPQPQLMAAAILDYLKGKSIREVSSLYAVPQGDLESAIDTLNWMIHCVTEIANMEGAKTATRIGNSLEERTKNRRKEKGLETWS
jgi:replicative superfamily II helicase